MIDAGILLLIVVILSFMGGGIFLIFRSLSSNRYPQQNLTWPAVKGKVLSFEVVESSGMTPEGLPFSTFKPVIRFIYRVNNTEYTAIQIGQSSQIANDFVARQMAEHYPVGKTVRVHYDPQAPSEAILSPQLPVTRSVLTSGIVLLLLGILIACIAFSIFLVYFFTH